MSSCLPLLLRYYIFCVLVLCALGTRGLEVKEWTEYGCGRKKVLASDVLKGKQANENFFFFLVCMCMETEIKEFVRSVEMRNLVLLPSG